jgi:Putative glucoamylase
LPDRYANYWNQCVNHTLFNYDYCIANPLGFTGYGLNCWGLMASYSLNDTYAAHCLENDSGIIALTVVCPHSLCQERAWPPCGISTMTTSSVQQIPSASILTTSHASSAWPLTKALSRWWKTTRLGCLLLGQLFMPYPGVQEGLQDLEFKYHPGTTSEPMPQPTPEPMPQLSPEPMPEPTLEPMPAPTPEPEPEPIWNLITAPIFFIVLLYQNVVVNN